MKLDLFCMIILLPPHESLLKYTSESPLIDNLNSAQRLSPHTSDIWVNPGGSRNEERLE
jgi:hypothetical protein